jgi:hypothetical protein
MLRIFTVFCLLLPLTNIAWSQCQNSLKVKNAAYQEGKGSGKIELEVKAKGEFVCTLNSEKGSGPAKITSKTGSGASVVIFENLDKNLIYQVEVEFLNEGNKFCKKLQRSQIILESK